MSLRRFARLALWLEELFPERHLYLRSGGEMRGFVLTPKRQLLVAGGVDSRRRLTVPARILPSTAALG